MLCQQCHKKVATIFFTQLLNNQVQKMSLCEPCARELGITDAHSFGLAEVLLQSNAAQKRLLHRIEVGVCPACGFSWEEFSVHGRLGCPKCYEVFEPHLHKALRSTQKSLRHEGKIPRRFDERSSGSVRLSGGRSEDVAWLRQALLQVVSREDFEEAARLRDRIQRFGVPAEEGGDQQLELW